jgi:alpha-amylase
VAVYRKTAGLAISALLTSLLLGACGEATNTPAPSPTTAAAPTAPAPTTAAVVSTFAATTAAPTPVSTPAQAPTNTPATTAATASALAPTATTGNEPAPTITIGPTPQPAPLTLNWVKEGACYEVFVRSFFDGNGDGKGDLPGLIAKLDYLNDGKPDSTKSLGVNCLWLMPVMASPSYHGYDTTDYYKVNPDYGSNDDFKKFMEEAHKRGIYVIIDLMLNHTSREHPWFKQALSDPKSPYHNWYIFRPDDPGYVGPWNEDVWFKTPAGNEYYYAIFDKDLPDLNFRNPEVTKQIQDVTRFWLKDMGVDGFRIDAAKHLIEDGVFQQNTPETKAWLRDYRKFYTSVKPDAYTIGEVNGPSLQLNGYYPDQLDAYFEFSVGPGIIRGARGGNNEFVGQMADANSSWPFQRYGIFLTNHDQNRVMNELQGDTGAMKLAATAYLTMPGLPFIYYGEEIGMMGSKPDEQIRTPMQWSNTANGGFTTGAPWEPLNKDLDKVNVQTQDADPNSLLNLYRKLVRTRRANPALGQGSFTPVESSEGSVAAYLRHSASQDLLVVMNLGEKEVSNLKLSVKASEVATGQYTPTELLTVNNSGPKFAALTVGAGGAITGYAPLPALPAKSAYIIAIKK